MFSIRRILIGAAGLAIGMLLCWLLFRDTDWAAVSDALRRARPGYLAASGLCFAGTYLVRAYRLRCILWVNGPARYGTAFGAMIIAVLAQLVVPILRVPLIQSVALSRMLPRPLSQCFGASATDRVVESSGLPFLMLIVLLAMPTAGGFTIPADVFSTDTAITISPRFFRGSLVLFSAMILTTILLLIALYRFRDRLAVRARRWSTRVGDGLHAFIESFHIFDDRRNLVYTLAANTLLWCLFLASVACALEAFSVPWPWYGPLLMLTLMIVSIIIPGAPGFVGQFHFAVVASVVLLAPEYPVSDAKALAIALHFIFVFSVFVLGVAGIMREHINLWEVGRSVEEAAEREGH